MESINQFLLEERATSEDASSIILIAMAAVMLIFILGIYYGAFQGFFEKLGTFIKSDLPPQN